MLNFFKIFTIFVPSVEKDWRHQNTLMRVCQNEQLFKYLVQQHAVTPTILLMLLAKQTIEKGDSLNYQKPRLIRITI